MAERDGESVTVRPLQEYHALGRMT
jgi:hypothetical protein